MKLKKYQFKNKHGDIREIFKGKGFTHDYIINKNLPLLSYKNEWTKGEIRLKKIDFQEFKNTEFQLYIKQQRLQYMFDIKLKKEDLLDDSFVVAFYEYEKYRNIFNYGVINLEEFLKRYRNKISLPLLMGGIDIDELEKAVQKTKVNFEEGVKQKHLSQDRFIKLEKEIAEKRKEKVVYFISCFPHVFYIERYTKASKKTGKFKTKEDILTFIEDNKRGDKKTGYEVICVDMDHYKISFHHLREEP